MKSVTALCMLFLMTNTSFAENRATNLEIRNGQFVVAQNYCALCADNATACRVKCNGSGTCVQACDDAERECHDQNCRRRY